MNMRHTAIVAAHLALSLLVGCAHGPRLEPGDFDQLSQLAAAVEAAPDEVLPGVIQTALTDVGLGRKPECRAALKRLSTADVPQRAQSAATSIDVCRFPCPTSLAAAADVAAERRTVALAARCDRAGPDPIFGGPLAVERARMTLLDYLVFRFLLDEARFALERDGSERARALWTTLQRSVPRLATTLSRSGSPNTAPP
jgi:hypothetical protein